MKVLKFGGTSMANAEAMGNVRDAILADAEAKYIVVSAPGKRAAGDTKVTDLLINCHLERDVAVKRAVLEDIKSRFLGIIKGLKINIDLSDDFAEIEMRLSTASYDYMVSRGEYLSAKVLSAALGYKFIDAKSFVRFNGNSFDAEKTDELGKTVLLKERNGVVIPGFYGENEKKEIVAFSRGGSDISGAIVARAVNASVYENWTDVDGFMVCDPRVVPSPRIIDMLTYKELRELSYMGASVLHPDSVFPVRKSNIPIHIRNTFNRNAKGTMIVPTSQYKSGKFGRVGRVITGIAGKKHFIGIFIEKQMMNNEVGFIKSLMDILCEYNVSLEHMPTGIDTLTLVIDSAGLSTGTLDKVITKIRETVRPDNLEVENDLALIAVVGHGMINIKGTASRLFGALLKADINIRMIDQGSSELNIIVAVSDSDYEGAIASIYKEFGVS